MQADVGPLIVFYVHCYLWLSGSSLFGLDVGPDHVIGLARRHPLRELAPVVRDLFPLRFLLVGASDLDGNAVGGAIVLAPYRAENQGVVFRRLLTTLVVPPERPGLEAPPAISRAAASTAAHTLPVLDARSGVVTVLALFGLHLFLVFLFVLRHLSEFQRLGRHHFEVAAAFGTRDDFALIDLVFLDVEIAFAFRTENHDLSPPTMTC